MNLCSIRILLQVVLLSFIAHPALADNDKPDQETVQYELGARALAERDYDKAIKIWKRLGRRGNAAASFNLGVFYAEGKIVEQSPRRALRWFKKAAKKGHPEAQYNLGHLYMQGTVGKPKPKRAVYWWREAAQRGLLVAQYNLAYALFHGIGADADQEEAITWFRRAAASGEARSAAFLDKRGFSYDFSRNGEHKPAAAPTKPGKPLNAGPPLPARETSTGLPKRTSIAEPEKKPEAINAPPGAPEPDIELRPTLSPPADPEDQPLSPTTESPPEEVSTGEGNIKRSLEPVSVIADEPRREARLYTANDHEWLFGQPSDNFALQLASLRLESTVAKMVRDDVFLQRDGKFFTTLINGEPWTYLLYGSYPDKASALEARSELPHWAQQAIIRGFSELQFQRCGSRGSLRRVLPAQEAADLERFCSAKGYQ